MTRVEVAVVGGGPAGAAVAALLARRGREVLVIEASSAWRWRACGVFTSPASVAVLRRIGLADDVLAAATRPIPAMRVETPDGTAFRLTYGDDGSLAAPAVGFDRAALDPALLALARAEGATVRTGATVRSVSLTTPRLEVVAEGGRDVVEADLVVGADGTRSIVAAAAGVRRAAPLAPRTGLTFHMPDQTTELHDARMVVLDQAYVGLAPVPGGRINVGIVLQGERQGELRRAGSKATVAAILHEIGLDFDPCDSIAGAAPLGHQVSRLSGPGWLLVGDAAGFLDPFTGEGLHRALVSAELAAAAVDAHMRGEDRGLPAYERSMRRRFLAKDAVSLVVQAFLARPAWFRYASRRFATRADVRETMSLVIGDLVPASRALDPRFLAALLRP